MAKIVWTKVDEAPALASYSLYPIIKSFLSSASIDLEQRDISLASRVLSTFTDKRNDDLGYLGELVTSSEANIIKLPNISASISQLKACITELQSQGFDIPDFPEEPKTDKEKATKAKYATCLGSAVNPVLREGNSDRRAAVAVKEYAQNNPHRLRDFEPNSQAHIAHMSEGDFYGNEQSFISDKDQNVSINLITKSSNITLAQDLEVQNKEIIDATFMSAKKLQEFYKAQIKEAKDSDMLLSIHLKATMMKVSDPIMFGYAIKSYFPELFTTYTKEFEELGVNANLGLGDLLSKIKKLDSDKQNQILSDIQNKLNTSASLAMVDSDKGITNLHASNNIIIDASLPVVVRDGGKMWNKDGKLQETKALVPDRTYATMYKEILEDCKLHGKFDVVTMGNVSNVGLMAKKAEEYGSHPTTFEIAEDGEVQVVSSDGTVLLSHQVKKGDIYRVVRTKDEPIKDWIKLSINRARNAKLPVIFWLDSAREHDANLIKKIVSYMPEYLSDDISYEILAPESAMRATLRRVRAGLDTISATGNVLRDYLTDLFPILELGSSSKMLSIVPLLRGGGLFETGAGGSAPKHVTQFVAEGHLRWDSLGEFLALAESIRFIYEKDNSPEAKILVDALDIANSQYLKTNKVPSRKVGEPDNKTSHYFLALYWAQAIANQTTNKALAEKFAIVVSELESNQSKILEELLSVEGKAQNIDGYFNPDFDKVSKAMRPSDTFNSIISSI